MATHLNGIGLTLDPKLTYSTHIHHISVHAQKSLPIIKTHHNRMGLTGGDIKGSHETGSVICFLHPRPASKLQVMQNPELRTATGCTQDTNIQHMHDEHSHFSYTSTLQLLTSQYKQKTQHTSHPLDKHKTYFNTPKLKHSLQQWPLHNKQSYRPPHRHYNRHKTNMRHIHTSIVYRHLATRGNKKILRTPSPHIIIS